MKVVLASSNPHKVKEINAIVQKICHSERNEMKRRISIFKSLILRIFGFHPQNDVNIEFILPPDGFDPIEDGETFEANSLIKARAAWELGKTWTLADDSGLCIDALNGAPGIHSARYAETPQARIDRVLKEMQGKENRLARFKCCMTLLNPQGEVAFTYTGVCEGSIVEFQRGVNGFGYDPIFLLSNSDKTMAELSEDDKNAVSHRFKALKEVLNFLYKN